MKEDRDTDKRHKPGVAALFIALFLLLMLLFGVYVMRYALGLSLREKYLRGPAQGVVQYLPNGRA